MATTSSTAKGIIVNMTSAVKRQTLHQDPTASGWRMMSVMLTMPSGTTRMKKKVTIQGMERQRSFPPIKPISISIV